MDNLWILAQAESAEAPSGITGEPITGEETSTTTVASDPNAAGVTSQRTPFGGSSLIFLGLMFVVMYLLLFRGPRKKQQQQNKMVQSLKKNDRVRTIGGIIGTIVDIKGDEITLKVDESSNTKIKVTSSAIGRNISEEK